MFKRFDLQEMKNRFSNVSHKVIYLNYNMVDGIKILDTISELSLENLKHFNKIHIFNDESMVTAYYFDQDEVKYSETLKSEFSDVNSIKEYYLEKCAYEKIRVRTGKTKDGFEKIQYTELVGER